MVHHDEVKLDGVPVVASASSTSAAAAESPLFCVFL
jgi:hypothetical protein